MLKKVAVIGGGVAGLEAARQLAALGYQTTVYEKNDHAGGHTSEWDRLFPNRRPAVEVVDTLKSQLNGNPAIVLSTPITELLPNGDKFTLKTNNKSFEADAVLIATGFELFQAERKEEYGYGIYDNVITSAELDVHRTWNAPDEKWRKTQTSCFRPLRG